MQQIDQDVSLVIITYNRASDIEKTLTVMENAFTHLKEVILVNNASTDSTSEILKRFGQKIPNLRVIDAEKNFGVAGGRNIGIREARGEILIFLDDDAEILTPDFVGLVRKKFNVDPLLGAIAFKIIGDKNQIRLNEFPHWDKRKPKDDEFLSAYFVGAGHALRKSALDGEFLYPEEFFYAQEELYLSYKMIEQGYRILYFPTIVTLHWQSGSGRVVNNRKWYLLLRNTLLVNHRFLPWYFLYLSIPVWSVKILYRCRSPKVVFGALVEFNQMKGKPIFSRKPFSRAALDYVKANGGRLWW